MSKSPYKPIPKNKPHTTPNPLEETALISNSSADTKAPHSTANDLWFLYLVRARNGSLYTGIAKDVEKRIATHNAGKGSKSLRALGLPVVKVYQESVGSYGDALRREAAIKKGSREEKEALVAGKHSSLSLGPG
jgi:putative endonuclease